MSHSMGLAAPGYVEHQLSMHLCVVGQRQLGHSPYILHTCLMIWSGASNQDRMPFQDSQLIGPTVRHPTLEQYTFSNWNNKV